MRSRHVTVNDDDIVSRLIFRPKDFLNGLGPLVLNKSLFFQSKDNYKESVNSQRLVNNFPEDLHEQGRIKAANDSEKKHREGKDPVTYEGFVSIESRAVRAINEDNHRFDVKHSPTKENRAHCDIELLFQGKKPKPAQRNLVIQKLSEGFSNITTPNTH